MEILFKSDDKFFLLKDGKLTFLYIKSYPNIPSDEIPHILRFPILYHLKLDEPSSCPVYYEHGDFVVCSYKYNFHKEDITIFNHTHYSKDYTEVNINKLLDGNIV